MKKTLIIGASNKPNRYAYKALQMLQQNGHEVCGLARRSFTVSGVEVKTGHYSFKNIHSITLYLSAKFQKEYYEYMVSLNPERVIFNPGTENPELYDLLKQNSIKVEVACTLVLLSTGQY